MRDPSESRPFPLPRRLVAAVFLTSIGTLVYLLLRHTLPGLIDGAWLLAGCILGALVSTAVLYSPDIVLSKRGIRMCAAIVLSTFVVVALLHVPERTLVDGAPLDRNAFEEALGMLFWEVFIVSWWLIPCVMATVWVFDRLWRQSIGRR